MKFTCNQQILTKALNTVSKAVTISNHDSNFERDSLGSHCRSG
jgi:hypothetical protein